MPTLIEKTAEREDGGKAPTSNIISSSIEEGYGGVSNKSENHPGRVLSLRSKMYDMDGDGVLDPEELALKEMDKDHQGHISIDQVYQLLKKQKALHEKVFGMKRLLFILAVLVVILAFSNLMTAWAAAILAKDTYVEDGTLIEKGTKRAVGTNTNYEEVAITEMDRNRRLQTSGSNLSLSKDTVERIYNECNTKKFVMAVQGGEEFHKLQICPSNDFTNATLVYTFTTTNNHEFVFDCSAAGDSCNVGGSALDGLEGLAAATALQGCSEDADCPQSKICVLDSCVQDESAGTTYYFEPSSTSTAEDGTQASPFRSFRKARKKLRPGDTLYLVGEISNPSFVEDFATTIYSSSNLQDPHLWHAENTLAISGVNGEPGKYITIRAGNNLVIKGDGGNVVRIQNCRYLRLIGLNVEGHVSNNLFPLEVAIELQFLFRYPYTTANVNIVGNEPNFTAVDGAGTTWAYDYRIPPETDVSDGETITDLPLLDGIDSFQRPSFPDTRGLYASNCHHLVIENCNIGYNPGTGLRVADSEYVDILDNEVHHNSLRASVGTHGLVPTKTRDNLEDANAGTYRMRILRNSVHNNKNGLYSWVQTKTIVTPHIDEGKGISLQRNNVFTNGGRILVANNVAYNNGFSGVHSNDGMNIDFIGNTAYNNSAAGRNAKNIGISFSDCSDCKLVNNIAVIDTNRGGHPFSVKEQPVVAKNNIAYGFPNAADLNLDPDLNSAAYYSTDEDPLFVDAANGNFQLQTSSPAADNGDAEYALLAPLDKDSVERNATSPDIGAFEIEAQTSDGVVDDSEL